MKLYGEQIRRSIVRRRRLRLARWLLPIAFIGTCVASKDYAGLHIPRCGFHDGWFYCIDAQRPGELVEATGHGKVKAGG